MSASATVVTWQRSAAVELTSGDTRAVVVPELGMVVGAFEVDGFDHVARPDGIGAVRGWWRRSTARSEDGAAAVPSPAFLYRPRSGR